MKTTKEMIEVMQAFEDRKEIEWKFFDQKEWKPARIPSWNWTNNNYRIKQNWWDNIPEGGVLCWVWDCGADKKTIMSIVEYDPSCVLPFFTTDNMCWEHATPLTQKEIQTFIDNAKEIGI